MSRQTVYALIKEAYESNKKAFYEPNQQRVAEYISGNDSKLYAALKSLESDPNIFKVVNIS